MANPFGIRTPWPDSFWYISPSEAFLPPTSGTSSMPNSSKKRTYLGIVMICPLVARHSVGAVSLFLPSVVDWFMRSGVAQFTASTASIGRGPSLWSASGAVQ